jgi:hypothetical protein
MLNKFLLYLNKKNNINNYSNEDKNNIDSSYYITIAQRKEIEKWRKNHEKNCKVLRKTNSRSGNYTYCFTPSCGLGDIIEFKCICGKSIDVTDINCW